MLARVKGALDRILRQCFAAPDLEFHWLLDQDEDNLAQAQVDQIYLSAGVKSISVAYTSAMSQAGLLN